MDNKLEYYVKHYNNDLYHQKIKEHHLYDLLQEKNDDYIGLYLKYWYKHLVIGGLVEIDKLWILDDLNKANKKINKHTIYADTIFSFYIPLKYIIEKYSNKKIKGSKKDTLKPLYDDIDKIDKSSFIYQTLNNFAKMACSRGNTINYPHKAGFQPCFQKRGFIDKPGGYSDLILKSLYECFDDGFYAKNFGEGFNFNNVYDFIMEEKLYIFFDKTLDFVNDSKEILINKIKSKSLADYRKLIKKENLIKIYTQTSNDTKWECSLDEALIILKTYTKIIEVRNELVG